MSRSAPKLGEVCARCGLGTPLAPWSAEAGGLSNELRRLVTTNGQFAIKRMLAGTQSKDFRNNVESSFRIEVAALAAGISAPRAIPADRGDHCLAEIGCEDGTTCLVRVHEWVDGDPVDHRALEPPVGAQLGHLIAMVHGLALPSFDARASADTNAREGWEQLGIRALNADANWARPFDLILPASDGLESQIRSKPDEGLVPGHRDADDKNTLMASGETLMLLDWDAAGAVDPDCDWTSVLLDWSGIRTGDPRSAVVSAMHSGYTQAADRKVVLDASEWIGAQLGWLHFSVLRALGDFGPANIAIGEREIAFFTTNLPRIARNLDSWLAGWSQV